MLINEEAKAKCDTRVITRSELLSDVSHIVKYKKLNMHLHMRKLFVIFLLDKKPVLSYSYSFPIITKFLGGTR